MNTRQMGNPKNGELAESEAVEVAREDNEAAPRGIEVHTVPLENKMLVRRERIFLPVTKSECGNYFVVESEDLDMSLSEESLEELKDAFDFILQMMWEEYVMGDPQKMTQGALELRKRLIETYRCV